MKKWFLWGILLTLAGCADRYPMAPVVGANWKHYTSASRYVVRRGDTLYSIAFRYDRDYRQLAAWNHLSSPYLLSIGQTLTLQGPQRRQSQPNRRFAKPHATTQVSARVPRYRRFWGRWNWPAHGRIASSFAPQLGKKGIDIAGQKGSKIYASRGGVVAYAGNGLQGYGNLIIIKHDNQMLTAYGNNARNLVSEGQRVQAGQVIAEMGIVNHQFYGVHFEIRQAGHPINPLNYL